jgi:hypothetical protein
MGLWGNIFENAFRNPAEVRVEKLIEETYEMRRRAHRQISEYPQPQQFLYQVAAEYKNRSARAPLPIPIDAVWDGLMNAVFRLYAALPMFALDPLPSSDPHNPYAGDYLTRTVQPYLRQHIALTVNSQETTQLLVSIFTNAVVAFVRALPHTLYKPTGQGRALPNDIKMLIAVGRQVYETPIQAFYRAFNPAFPR